MEEQILKMLEACTVQSYQEALNEIFREYVGSEIFNEKKPAQKVEITNKYQDILELLGKLKPIQGN